MKFTIKIILPAVFIALAIWAGFRLNANKEKIQADASAAAFKVQEIPVKVTPAAVGSITAKVSETGILAAVEELVVISETQGKIGKVRKQVGDYVSKDEVIVEVDDEVIAANVLVAEANYDQMDKDLRRIERLQEGNAIAKHDLEQARIGLKKAEADLITARKALRDTKIKAPIAGVVNKRMVEPGQFLTGGMPVCEIVNTSKLRIWVKVGEQDIFKIYKGMPAEIMIPAIYESNFNGRVNAIGEKADRTMKFDVEILVDNPEDEQRLKAGLFAEVRFPVKPVEKIIISKTALVGSMKSPSVFVAEDGKAVRKTIVTGDDDGKNIEVVSGLKEGDLVIVSGQLNLNAGNILNIIE